MRIIPGDFSHPAVKALLTLHLQGMRDNSPPGHSFALDWSALQKPEISFYTCWDDEVIAGCGALLELSPTHGEIKSMRTDPKHLRKGVATHLLRKIIDVARDRGYKKLSLETGTGPAFEAAVTMYLRHGFKHGGAFADYEKSDFNELMHLDLQ
jgi:putative acetyltransferase